MSKQLEKPTHEMPSGMGGVLGVKVLQQFEDGQARVMVTHPYDGWYGKVYTVDCATLSPVERRAL